MLKINLHDVSITGFPSIILAEYCTLTSSLIEDTKVFGETKEEKRKKFEEIHNMMIKDIFEDGFPEITEEDKERAKNEIELLSLLSGFLMKEGDEE